MTSTYCISQAFFECRTNIKRTIGAKTYLTHLSSPAILYKGITNPYHYLPIAMTKPN